MCNSGSPTGPEQVEALLKERLGTRVRGLRVLIREGGVVLQGTVYTWYSKQIAQQVAMRELRLTVLANEIEVRWDLGRSSPSPDYTFAEGEPIWCYDECFGRVKLCC